MRSLFPLLAFGFMLIFAGGCNSEINADAVPDLPSDKLYQEAQACMEEGDFDSALRYLEAMDSRYPFGELTDQVQLDLIYCYYKSRRSEMTEAAISRYLRLNPMGQYTDYVMYMNGLNEMQKRSDIIQDFLGLNRAEKDPTNYYAALRQFRELIETYPDSPYVRDARQRMLYIREQLAEREMQIARYYYEREAFLSSIRHCQSILYSFRHTNFIRPALELMAESYLKLGLPEPASNTRKVIAASFVPDA